MPRSRADAPSAPAPSSSSTRSPLTQIDARVGLQQAEDDLQDRGLARAAGAEDDLRVALDQREADVLQDDLLVEGQRRRGRRPRWAIRARGPPRSVHRPRLRARRRPRSRSSIGRSRPQYEQRQTSSLVTKKSTASTPTDAATTALVVARPTPCVPPDVRRPTWQPMVTMTKPRKNGLIEPHPDVLREQALDDRGPVDARRRRAAARPATIQPPTMPDAIGDDRQHRHHHEPGEHARHDQLADRVGARARAAR